MLTLALALQCLLVLQASAQSLPSYKCPTGMQRTLTNFGGITFQLDVSPANSTYLQPNMDCGILIVGYTTSRWLITIENISLGAYQAQMVIQDGSVSGKELISVTSAGTPYRQIGTSGTFNVRLTTKSGSAGLALGVRLTIELLDKGKCPNGWYTASGNTAYCYGVPKLASNLTYDEATKGCNLALANLVMGNFEYDSIASELAAAPTTVIDIRVAYWVGLYYTSDDIRFLNKYNTLDDLSGRLCSKSSSSCNCVAYQNGRFYQDDCASRRPYLCYMPKGGTSSYYDVSSLIASAASIITIVAIVLTVCFIVAVIISLAVVLICCIRRNTAYRRNSRSRREAATAAVVGGFVQGGPGAVPVPPPYPMMPGVQAPPYPAEGAAPPYTPAAVYANAGFEACAGGAEKPPAYEADWVSSGQQVPA